jgi:hypothetical protein
MLALSRLEKLERFVTILAAVLTVAKTVKELRHVDPPQPTRKRGKAK